MDFFNYRRRNSDEVRIGDRALGGSHPVRLQSMTNTSTLDTESSVEQIRRIADAGADYVRLTAQGEREAANLAAIRNAVRQSGYATPLVADIHFNPRAAFVAAECVEKVRINPGNFAENSSSAARSEAEGIAAVRERLLPLLDRCRQHDTALRIGVNHGSLSPRMLAQYGNTPAGLVASCLEYLRVCRDEGFDRIVLSVKASDTVLMVRTVRRLIEAMDRENMHYPLHLGVTEAGEGEDGRIKSAVGIGALLADGIGDTVRVSLSEAPEAEIPVARRLVDYVAARAGQAHVEASASPRFRWSDPQKRNVRAVGNIGGDQPPIVVSDRSRPADDALDPVARPDYLYTGSRTDYSRPDGIPRIVDACRYTGTPGTHPLFRVKDAGAFSGTLPLRFLQLSLAELTPALVETLRKRNDTVLVHVPGSDNTIGERRALHHRLLENGLETPVVLCQPYRETRLPDLQLKAAVDFGSALVDRFGEGLWLPTNGPVDSAAVDKTLFAILQATRLRTFRTEYISCPGCGRTLYDLETAIARVKAATSHLKGLRIAVMGCIVNGPGEMADADFGYVGAGKGRISLYKGRTCVEKNIPETEAVGRLVALLKTHGAWQEPPAS